MKQRQNKRYIRKPAVAVPRTPYAWLGISRPASLRLLLVLIMLLGSGISVVYLTHQGRFLFTELQQLKSQANELQVEWGQLLIEQSTFGLEGIIEQKATEQLSMRIPDLEQIVMVRHE